MDRKVISDSVTFYYYFSTVVFMSYIENCFRLNHPKKISVWEERGNSHLAIWLFGSLKFLLHLFSDTYSNSQSIILDFSLPLGFLWQKIVKAGPWIYMCIIQASRITFNLLGAAWSELRSANEYFMWDLCNEADTSSLISCFSTQIQGHALWMEEDGLITLYRSAEIRKQQQ